MCNSRFKFRAWGISPEMVYLPFAGIGYYDFEGSFAMAFAVDEYSEFWAHENYEEKSKELTKNAILMQFTGLHDKNGKEIYEGDIIKDLLTNAVYLVKIGFCKKYAFTGVYVEDSDGSQNMINNDSDQKSNSNIEIIGNIYENPELLNP